MTRLHAVKSRQMGQKEVDPGSELRQGYSGAHAKIFEAANAVPRGLICLVSALELHGVISTPSNKVWVAIANKDRRPSKLPKFVRIVWMAEAPFSAGRVNYQLTGTAVVPTFSAAKAVVDCFKFRTQLQKEESKILSPPSLLRIANSRGRAYKSDLRHFATICRMSNVMSPYLEML